MPSDLVVPLSFRVDGLQYLQCQAVHMEFGDVEAWDVYLTSTTEKVRKTPKNVGDAGVMRHATWFTFRRALKILTIYVYTYIYIYTCNTPKKSLPKSGSLGVRQNIFFGQPECLQGCAMPDS